MNAVLIQSPHPDFDTFLAGAHKLLGKSVSKGADRSQLALTDAEKFRMCLAEFQGRDGQELNHHLTYSVLMVGYQDELLELLSLCGMPCVVAETTIRGAYAAVLTGTAVQWQSAIEAGVKTPHAATLFNRLRSLFGQETTLKLP